MTTPQSLGVVLWLCSVLMLLRVIGQLVVVLRAPRWLPPMAQWQSGLVPYAFLLFTQGIVLVLMFSIAADFTENAGFWVRPMPVLGRIVLGWSYVYASAMVVRYAIRMARRPDQRWTGGTIPIIFHVVLAAFQWTFAQYHVGPGASGFATPTTYRSRSGCTADAWPPMCPPSGIIVNIVSSCASLNYGRTIWLPAVSPRRFVIARTARGASRAMLKSPPRAS